MILKRTKGLSLVFFLTIFYCFVEADDIFLKKISLDQRGQIRSLHLQYKALELRLDGFGHIKNIAVSSSEEFEIDYRISGKNRLETVNDISIQYRFIETGELYMLGDLSVEFDPFYPNLIEKIGHLEFEYNFIGDKPSYIKKLGALDFNYRYPDYRLEKLGEADFNYSLQYNERIESVMGMIDEDQAIEIYIDTALPARVLTEEEKARIRNN
ncbi:MAG: hypothetical protein KAI81_07170 [Candidatus Marinimicrobia bacterium]|nr:hypothetical protein [Candidatus Neomarinimicrobiota bacterium]